MLDRRSGDQARGRRWRSPLRSISLYTAPMPRRRRLRPLIRLSSTLLSAVVFAAWVGSAVGSASWSSESYRAHLEHGVLDVVYYDDSGFVRSRCGGPPLKPLPTWTVGGVRFQYGHYLDEPLQWRPRFSMQGGWFWALDLPLWMPLVPLATVAGVTNTRALRERRRRCINACAACGYDRTGLTPAVACPECGAEQAEKALRTL